MTLKRIAGPAVPPVSVAEVMTAFRGDDEAAFTAQATLIIQAMTSQAETRIGRALITQTVELVLDAFPCAEIDLVMPNVQSIESVKYIDPAGVEQTLDSNRYFLDGDSTPGWLFPAYNTSWPETMDIANALRVRYKVGYGDAPADVPVDLRLWIIAHATQVLENPNGLGDQAFRPLPWVDTLLHPYIVYRVM